MSKADEVKGQMLKGVAAELGVLCKGMNMHEWLEPYSHRMAQWLTPESSGQELLAYRWTPR